MRYTIPSLALASAVSARTLSSRAASCCFGIDVSGNGISGTLGQLSDGQNRVGPNQSGATYCINNGQITDNSGRGCIVTSTTTQFQCNMGDSPMSGFALSSSGALSYEGSSAFYACPVDTDGNYNIYTQPLANMPKCVAVSLASNNGMCPAPTSSTCKPSTVTNFVTQHETATVYKTQEEVSYKPTTLYVTKTIEETQVNTVPGPTSTVVKTEEETTTILKTELATTTAYATEFLTTTQQAPPQTVTKTVATTTTVTASPSASSTCPAELPDMSAYQMPHLIVPVNSEQPSTAYGTQYNAYIGGGNSTIFNFDIPMSYSGKQCTVIFTLPTQAQLSTSFVQESGKGGIDFKQLKSPATKGTTFDNAPAVAQDFGVKDVSAGNAYTITSGNCAVGSTLAYELSATGDYQVEYFQDYNPCPIGLWIIAS